MDQCVQLFIFGFSNAALGHLYQIHNGEQKREGRLKVK